MRMEIITDQQIKLHDYQLADSPVKPVIPTLAAPVRFTAALMLETNDIPRPAQRQKSGCVEAQQVAVQVFYYKRSGQNVIIHSAFCGANNQRESSNFRLIFLHGWN